MVEFTGSAYSRTKSNHYSFFFFLHFTVSQHSEFLLHVYLHEVAKSWVSYNTNEFVFILSHTRSGRVCTEKDSSACEHKSVRVHFVLFFIVK